MTTQHTPGPWTVAEHGVLADKITSHGNWYVCSLIDPDNPEDKANARLIAAAPDLLAALEAMVESTAHPVDMAHARAVIAKARGE